MSNSHSGLPFSRKTRSFFRNTNRHQKERALRFSISKASYYPVDEFVQVLKELSDLPSIDHFNASKKKYDLLLKIMRILKVHNRNAFKIINKEVEDFKDEDN